MNIHSIQPLYAFVELSIGGTVVSDFNDNLSDTIIDLEFERTVGSEYGSAGSKFTISLYDDTALEIEEIVSSSTDVTINYGWAKNASAKVAESSLDAIITEYQLAFEGASLTLTITGTISSVAEARGSVSDREFDADTYEGKPSEIVKKICEDEGWDVGYIEDTEPVLDDDGNPKSFSQNNLNSGRFIKSLREMSVSALSGATGYNFFVDEEDKIYFVSTDNTQYTKLKSDKETPTGSATQNAEYEASETSSDDVEISGTYEFYSGRTDNTVISFTPEFKGVCIADTVPETALSVDSVKNEMMACTMSGSYAGTDKQAKKIMGISSTSFNNLETRAKSMWTKFGRYSYQATLEIIGDPTVKINSNIYVAVFTKYGFLHHTSGIYFIKKAVDSISGGKFTTELTLLKLGNNKDNLLSPDEAEQQYSNGNGGNDEGYSSTDSSNSSNSSNGCLPDTAPASTNPKVEAAVQWAVKIANNDSHGYQWGGSHGSEQTNYDCSSYVSWAFKHGGFNVPVCGTGSMISEFKKAGFKWYPGNPDKSKLVRGDIVINPDSHVELYIGDGKLAGAHSNYDKKSGDSGGNEINIKSYSGTWQGVLRYEG